MTGIGSSKALRGFLSTYTILKIAIAKMIALDVLEQVAELSLFSSASFSCSPELVAEVSAPVSVSVVVLESLLVAVLAFSVEEAMGISPMTYTPSYPSSS
jgi:hypothetical protein